MFSSLKTSVASLLAFSALAQATITITNFNIVGNSTSTITWASSDPDTDPTLLSITLTNPNFHTQFAVGTNVPTTQGKITFETPGLIPGPNYGLQFIAINNSSDILAASNSFTVAEHDSTSSSTSGASTSGSSTSFSSVSGTTTVPVGVPITGSSSGSGSSSTSAPSASPTSPSSSGSSSGSSTGTGTSSSSASNSSASVFGSGGNGAAGLNVPASGMTLLAFLGGLVGLLA